LPSIRWRAPAEQLWAAAVFVLLVAEEAQQAAITAKRERIARQLHDMIAHNVSVAVARSPGNTRPRPSDNRLSLSIECGYEKTWAVLDLNQ
jgi:signal transduction histidine kinase